MVVESGFDFWATKLTPGKVVKCTVSDALLHVTSIALDETISNSKERTVVTVMQGDRKFVIASLREGVCEHVAVDLMFRENELFKFKCSGQTPVHLVGYIQPLADEEDCCGESDEEDSDDDDFSPMETIDEGESEEEQLEELPEDASMSDEASLSSSDVEDEEEQEEASKSKSVGQKRDIADLSSEDDEESEEAPVPAPPAKKSKKQLKAEKKQEQTPVKVEKKQEQTPKVEKKQPQTPKSEKKQPQTPKTEKKVEKQQPTPKKSDEPQFRKLPGGLMVMDVETGHGKEAKNGKVGVFYTGRLKNGKIFDSNVNSNKPFNFRLGAGEVIKGWELGVKGMRVGGKRKLIIPAKLGYGKQGAGNDIPPNSVLIFDVELARC